MSQEFIDKVKNQKGSNGEIGWPIAVRDRIHFPHASELRVTDASVGVTFLWTERGSVIPNLDKENLAIAANFYTPSGIEGMIRNILGNPFIRNVIMLGNEYSSKKESSSDELTSANAIRSFFEEGLDENKKLRGFGNSVYLDKNIPAEEIEKARKNVKLIDLNKQMREVSLEEKVIEANRLMQSLERGKPFGEPKTFDYEKMSSSFPYEGGPLIVHGQTIPDAWIKMISSINRFGVLNLMNANTDRKVKEINNMTVVVHDPQNEDLTLNPFLVPLTPEKIKAYQTEILSPLLPEGKAYTYGNKLRAYLVDKRNISDITGISEVVGRSSELGWEFPKDSHDKNINCLENGSCEIDQIRDIVDVLKRDPYSKACVAVTWHPAEELMRKHKSSPCLVYLHSLIQNEKLNLTTFFRSHDMAQGWPENAYGCAAIQREIADKISVEPGLMTIISGSAQIYGNYHQQVNTMLEKYKALVNNCSDSRGNFQIGIRGKGIYATLTHPRTGIELETYSGETAHEVRDKICARTELQTPHAIYLGEELVKAELALKQGRTYEQG